MLLGLWEGCVFDCGSSNHEISLHHSRFNLTDGGTTGTCNNGNIVGQSMGVENNCYILRLYVRISSDIDTTHHTPINSSRSIATFYPVPSMDGNDHIISCDTPLPPSHSNREYVLLEEHGYMCEKNSVRN